MNLSGIVAGDIVKVDRKGRQFYAKADGTPDSEGLGITPLDSRISYRSATAREVTEHYRKMGRPRPVKS